VTAFIAIASPATATTNFERSFMKRNPAQGLIALLHKSTYAFWDVTGITIGRFCRNALEQKILRHD
jgi:hypothetical protein